MKNPELFHKTVGILVNAYFNNILEYSDCKACAVGNLISTAQGTTVIKESKDCYKWKDESKYVHWSCIINTSSGRLYERNVVDGSTIVDAMLSTGYSLQELANIELAFYMGIKTTWRREESDVTNFSGLMSVCDTLMQIHEATTEEIKEAKSLFVKELAV